MVHKKYTHRGGKVYGPYLYENKRVGNKVVTQYVGKGDGSPTGLINIRNLAIALVLIVLAVFFVYQYNSSPTGRVSLSVEVLFKNGEPLSGNMKFNVKEGELVPKDSQVLISLGNQTKTYSISELVLDQPVNGNFYAEDSSISGSGEGYGVMGTKIIYPKINFQLLFSQLDDEEETNSGAPIEETDSIEETEGIEENAQIPAEDKGEGADAKESTDTEVSNENAESQENSQAESGNPANSEKSNNAASKPDNSESSNVGGNSEGSSGNSGGASDSSPSANSEGAENSGSENSGLTGAAVTETEYTVEGETSKDSPFTTGIQDGWDADIVSGSVSVNGTGLSDNTISVESKGNQIEVTTEYFVNERGYGEEYLGDYGLALEVDMEKLGLTAELGELSVKLVYGGQEIASLSKKINTAGSYNESSKKIKDGEEINITVNETVLNKTISQIRDIPTLRVEKGGTLTFSLADYFAGAEEYSFEGTNITSEITDENITLTPDAEYKGAIIATITATAGEEALQSNSFTILVSSGRIDIKTSRSDIKVGEPVKWTKEITLDAPEEVSVQLPSEADNVTVSKIEEGMEEEAQAEVSAITGNVVIEVQFEKEARIVTWLKRLMSAITGRAITDIEENNTEAIEVVLSDNATQYNIEYYTDAPIATEELTDEGKQVIISGPDGLNYTDVLSFTEIPEVFNVGQENEIKVFWVENESYIPFDAYDLSGNDKLDYIEWITPHLSNQTFEIILITNAIHLNETKDFVENIYEEVRERDSIFKSIPNGHYARITFERNLSNGKDITIYAKSTNGGRVRVYEKDSTTLLADFGVISDDRKYTIVLGNLEGAQDTFDLEVINGDVEFDYIVDPATTISLLSGDNTEDVGLSRDDGDVIFQWRYWSKWNITSVLGNTIDDARLCLYLNTKGGGADNDVNISYVTSQGWKEGDTAASIDGLAITNQTTKSKYTNSINTYNCINVTLQVMEAVGLGHNNFSIRLLDPDAAWSLTLSSSGGAATQARYGAQVTTEMFDTAEGTNRPILNITYTEVSSADTTSPSVTLNAPATGSNFASLASIAFNATVTDARNVTNATLYIWNASHDIVNQSTVVLGNVSIFVNTNIGIIRDGSYKWNYLAFDNSTNSAFASANYTFVIDSTAPGIGFVAPTPSNGSQTSNSSFIINTSIIESNLNVSVFNWNGTNYTIYNDSLLLMYNFNNISALGENSTDVKDISNYGNNGSVRGDAVFTRHGKHDGSYLFDDNNDYINITNSNGLHLTGNLTISAWINATNAGTERVIAARVAECGSGAGNVRAWEPYHFSITDGEKLRYGVYRTNDCAGGYEWDRYDTTAAIPTGQWVHVTATVLDNNQEARTVVLYVNGRVAASTQTDNFATTDAFGQSFYTNFIGARSPSYLSFNGSIDEFRIWNRTLTADEIKQQYMTNLAKYSTTQWNLIVNQSKNSTAGLDLASYTYFSYARDQSSNSNITDVSSIETISGLDTTNPGISFVSPTPANATQTANTSFISNVSITESNLKDVVWNWNGTNYTLFDNSLVLKFNFDSYTRMNDTSPSAQTVNCLNCPTFNTTSSRYNEAYTFDGSNDHINITHTAAINPNGSATYSMWINPSSLPAAYKDIFQKDLGTAGSQTYLRTTDSSQIEFSFYNGERGYALLTKYTVLGLTAKTWQHLLVTVNDTSQTSRIYVNGILKNSTSGTASSRTPGTGDMTIGGSAWDGWFGMTLDEFMMWNRSLSADEIQEVYMTNLYKINETAWYLIVNQSKNSTAGLDLASYTYFSYARDQSSNSNITDVNSITVTNLVADSISPNVTSLTEAPTDPAIYSSSARYYFNATVTDETAVGAVLLQFNGVNYSVLNGIGSVYNFSISPLGATTYSYLWRANDTSNNVNATEAGTYTINRANSEVNLTLNRTERNITLITGDNIRLNGTLVTGDSSATLQLYSNGTLINVGVGTREVSNQTTFTTLGLYNISVFYLQSENYSLSSETYWVEVTAAPDTTKPGVSINFPANTTYTSANTMAFNVTLSETGGTVLFTFNSGRNNYTMTSTDNLNYNYTNNSMITGSHIFHVYANDSSGNKNYTENVTFNFVQTTLTACGALNSPQTYTLANNVSSNGTCFTINSSNVVLNCAGYNVNYSKTSVGYGITGTGKANVTIRGCDITSGSTSANSHGIQFINTSNITITNSSVLVTGASARGMLLQSTNGTLVNSTNVFVRGSNGVGILVFSSLRTSIVSTSVNTSGATGYAVTAQDSNYTMVSGASLNTSNSSAYGILFQRAYYSNVSSTRIFTKGTTAIGIFLASSPRANIDRVNITTLGGTNAYAVSIAASSNTNVTNSRLIANGTSSPAVMIQDGVANTTIINNSIYSDKSAALSVQTTGAVNKANIYNNIFNGTLSFASTSQNDLNTTKVAMTNIIGGSNIGGNYWTTKALTGFSDTCADSNSDTICDSTYTIVTNSKDFLPLTKGDGVNPAVTIKSPRNNTFVNGIITLTTNASDNVGVKNVTFEYTNSTVTTFTLITGCAITAPPYSCSWDSSAYSNNSEGYVIRATVYDHAGNTGSDTKKYVIDRNRPRIKDESVIYPSGQASVRNGQNITLRVNASDSLVLSAGMQGVEVDLTGLNGSGNVSMKQQHGSLTNDQWSYWNLTVPIAASSATAGANIYVYDNATPTSNVRDSDLFTVVIDNNAPTHTNLLNTPQSPTNLSSVEFYLEVSDNFNLSSYKFSHNFTGTWQNETATLTGTSNFISISKTLTTGGYGYQFYVFDDAGNANQTALETFSVGGNPEAAAVLLIAPLGGDYFSSQSIDFSYYYTTYQMNSCSLYLSDLFNDSASTPANYTINTFSKMVPNGFYSFFIECTREESGESVLYASPIRTFNVDSIAPAYSSLTEDPAGGSNYSASRVYEFNVTWTDNSPLRNVSIEFSGTNYTVVGDGSGVHRFTRTGLTPGTYNYYWYAKDYANNTNFTTVQTYTISDVDGTAPNLTILYPANITYNLTTLTLNYSVGNDAQACWYSTNGGTTNTTVECGVNATGLTASEGSNTWRVYANDSAGNVNGTETTTFSVDTTGPTITINFPLSQTHAISSIVFNVSTSETSTCLYSLDNGRANKTMSASGGISFNATNATVLDGNYNVSYYCRDSYSNLANKSRSFIVDTQNPVVNLLNFDDTDYINYSNSINFNYSISTTNTDSCWYTTNNGAANTTVSACANFTLTLAEGNHLVKLYINSTAGLRGTDSVNLTVDLTYPVAVSIFPADSASYTASSQLIGFEYNVSEQNIANCSLVLNSAVVNSSTNVNTSASAVNNISYTVSTAQSYTWQIRCIDLAGNENNTASRTFTLSAPAVSSGGGSSGGSGGSGGASISGSTTTNYLGARPNEVRETVVAGRAESFSVDVINLDSKPLSASISIEGLSGVVLAESASIRLNAGEEKRILFNIAALNSGNKVGKIVFRGGGSTIEVPVIIDVRTENFLFDVALSTLDAQRTVQSDDVIKAQVNLLQVGPKEKVDVIATYVIKDFSGNIYIQQSETFFVLESKDFVKDIPIDGLPPGKYVLGLEVSYPGAFATSSTQFEVLGREGLSQLAYLLILGVFITLVSALVIIWALIRRRIFSRPLRGRNI